MECKSPYYAFPTKYPPDVNEDPFPCRSHPRPLLSRPEWYRVATTQPIEAVTIDMEDLIDSFSRMSLKQTSSESHEEEEVLNVESQSKYGHSWNPFIVLPVSAPLCSLVRCRVERRAEMSPGLVADFLGDTKVLGHPSISRLLKKSDQRSASSPSHTYGLSPRLKLHIVSHSSHALNCGAVASCTGPHRRNARTC